jgi:hypothetical protein
MAKRRDGNQIAKFDSQALKVGNRPDLFACRWRATYHWKALDKGYNFASNFISIEGLHTKLWPLKIARVPTLGFLGFPLGSPGTKWHLVASPVAMNRVYYKGGGWWLLSSPNHGESCEFVFACGSSMHQKRSNYVLTTLLFGLCKSVWIIDACQSS